MDPVRSRCLCVRVAAPSLEVVQEQLYAVAKKEGLQLPAALAARIAASSCRDLRRALLTLEVCRVQQYPLKEDQAVHPADWEAYIAVRARAGPRVAGSWRGPMDRAPVCCVVCLGSFGRGSILNLHQPSLPPHNQTHT